MSETHGTVTPGYGRCAGCAEIKQVTPDGVVQVHNGYRADGTTVAVLRCPGSGEPPVDLGIDELGA